MKKFFNVFKITLLMIVLSLLLVEAGAFLRNLFTNQLNVWQKNLTTSTTKHEKLDLVFASSGTHKRIIEDTPLLKTTNDIDTSHTNTLFILPKSYFVKVIREVTLDSGASGYYVRYNTYEGYAVGSAFLGAMSDNSTMQSGINITLAGDAGTYLRSEPIISDNNKLKLIPATTNGIILIGKIYGDTPSDGNNNIWYFVEYSSGPTTTYTGYIYSERCSLSSPLVDLVLDEDRAPQVEQPPADNTITSDANITNSENLNASISMSSGLMWIIAIIFIIPTIVIFIMLIKKPRKTLSNEEVIANVASQNLSNTKSLNSNAFKFEFDENIMPTHIPHSKHKRDIKFRNQNFDKLARFVKFDTSLESAEAFDSGTDNYDNIINMTNPATPYTNRDENNNLSPKSTLIKPKKVNFFSSAKEYPNSKLSPPKPNPTPFDSFNPGSEGKFENAIYDTHKPKPRKASKKLLRSRTEKNRKRATFNSGILASDDYFEFADSFDNTTPINSHYVFENKTTRETKKSGKKINRL